MQTWVSLRKNEAKSLIAATYLCEDNFKLFVICNSKLQTDIVQLPKCLKLETTHLPDVIFHIPTHVLLLPIAHSLPSIFLRSP